MSSQATIKIYEKVSFPGSGSSLEWDILLKGRICSRGANSFLYELIPSEKGGKTGRDASSAVTPIHLNTVYSSISFRCLGGAVKGLPFNVKTEQFT